MKTALYNIEGKKIKEINLPKCFSSPIREDIVLKVFETKKIKQPYSPSPVAGKQYSARGKIRHRRHVWQTSYGRGMSRDPRKVMSRRGTQFNWEAASIPFAKGGMRAHPPKIISMINTKKINKNELKIALNSAISSTADPKRISKKYERVEEKSLKEVPFVIESKLNKIKSKDLIEKIKLILGENLFQIALKRKTQRAGKGKTRGRKYKSNAGLLIVTGEKEKLKTNAFEVVNVKNLGLHDLARGGLGRLTLYTEEAIKYLENKK
jgi:large subunit ribosomal protein L4e